MNIEQQINIIKPTVLIFTGNYLPGWKAGGILRTIVNTTEQLSPDFNFKIVTRDRDLNDLLPYPDIDIKKWVWVKNSLVYYVDKCSLKNIETILKTEDFDLIFLNGFFDIFTIKVLLRKKLNRIQMKPIIVSPRGEFAQASIRLKYPKKYIFIKLAKFFGLYNDITWHASSEFEAQDISKVMNISLHQIKIALDLPDRIFFETPQATYPTENKTNTVLKIIFLSRISREKNLDYALKILSDVRSDVIFDIYGPPEDKKYLEECKNLALQLPTNVKCTFFNAIHPEKVHALFSNYDLFFFPTGGENYGHAIAESLSAGTTVLISDKTPWRNLEKAAFGWDLPLENKNGFVEKIEQFSLKSHECKVALRRKLQERASEKLRDPKLIEQNRKLFTDLLS